MAFGKRLKRLLTKAVDTWGRTDDRTSWPGYNTPPQENPEDTTPETFYDISLNPFAEAGLIYRDVSNLFVSAGGMEEDEEGKYYPAQLIYTRDDGDPEILEALAVQYDEAFENATDRFSLGGFAPILRKLERVRKQYGYCIAENHFIRGDVKGFKDFIWCDQVYSRDPQNYVFDYEGEPGLYRYENGIYSTPTRMDANKFMSYAYNPLFDNPYGTSINVPLRPYFETFNKIFGYRRHALEKAGLGFIIAHYPERFAGADTHAVNWRGELATQLKNLVSGAYGMIHEAVNLESLKLDSDAQAFVDWHLDFVRAVSILYTGSATALIEGQYGSRSMAEATVVREKSKREQFDASEVSAFWTYQFNRIWVDLNFPPERIGGVYPTLQLIEPELITPTTPKDQEQISISAGEPEPHNAEMAAELQEEEQPTPPVAVPVGYEDFPSTTPTPEPYANIAEGAQEYLDIAIHATPYNDIEPGQGRDVFSVKRLRSFENQAGILEDLKQAIIPTLTTDDEAQAWRQYYASAVNVFRAYGLDMDTAIRDDLLISFRQTRQNAFAGALLEQGRRTGAVGMRIRNLEDGHDIRYEHSAWNNVVVGLSDVATLERVLPPSDFGCLCYFELVYDAAQVTDPANYPTVWPGETYKYYKV